MRTGRTTGAVRLVWPALALPLGFLLAACSTSQTAVSPPATSAPVNTSLAPTSMPAITATPFVEPATTPATATETTVATLAPTQAASPPPTGLTATAGPPATAGSQATASTDPAVAAVLAYLDARARTDVAAATSLSCKSWKSKAITEVTSFRSMNAKLVGVTCRVNGSAGAFTLVGCGGKMVTTYGTETRDWDLSSFVYQVAAEDGQWKMCGYH